MHRCLKQFPESHSQLVLLSHFPQHSGAGQLCWQISPPPSQDAHPREEQSPNEGPPPPWERGLYLTFPRQSHRKQPEENVSSARWTVGASDPPTPTPGGGECAAGAGGLGLTGICLEELEEVDEPLPEFETSDKFELLSGKD